MTRFERDRLARQAIFRAAMGFSGLALAMIWLAAGGGWLLWRTL